MNKTQYWPMLKPLIHRYFKQNYPSLKIIVSFIIICLSALFSTQVCAQDTVQRPNEMEFDARVIQGQRAEGAVYLFQRANRSLPPLLKYKRDYLSAIVSPIFSQNTALGRKLKEKVSQGTLAIGKNAQSMMVPAQAKPPAQKQTTTKAKSKPRKAWRKLRRKSKHRGRK